MFETLRNAVAVAAAATIATALLGLASTAQAGSDGGAWHLFQTPEQMQRSGRVPPILGQGEVLYYGGTVFSSVEVVSVIWGPDVNSQTVAEMPDFLSALPNSTFMDQLNQYSTAGAQSQNKHNSNQTISRGSFISQVQITPQDTNTTLTDKEIREELAHQIGIGALPPNGPDVLYMVFFPPTITIKLGKALSCQSFGAYHSASSKKQSPNDVYYGVMPDCQAGFDFLTFATSHEFAEATTDNIPTPGSHPKFPQAWNSSNGDEIADLCENASPGTLTDPTRSYQVTQVWLNTTNACSTGDYTSP